MGLEPIRIPSGLNEEDPFLIISDVHLSLRQMLSVAGGIMLWVLAAQLLAMLLSPYWLCLVLTGFIPVLGVALAFMRRDGRPIELWIADRVIFAIHPTEYALVRREATAEDRKLSEIFEEEDDFVL